MRNSHVDFQRRKLLRYGGVGLTTLLVHNLLVVSTSKAAMPNLASIGPLQAPDQNGVRLPQGYSSRIVAYSGQNLFGYSWHAAPDGGATFATDEGGWIYVSNSEMKNNAGGVGALHFDHNGKLINAYSILENTNRNCAGGATPWQTWLSCEEIEHGLVWECDPFGEKPAQVRRALGRFNHEAVAVDTKNKQLYLTEDEPDGCLYRYTPNLLNATGHPDLEDGFLEVAEILGDRQKTVCWHRLSDPEGTRIATRKQIKQSSHFNGGEGIWYHQGIVYFTTKGDNRVWAYDTLHNNLDIIYDAAHYASPVLSGVDNITANAAGELLVAEDGGDMQIVILSGETIKPLLQLVGHDRSEITGPAFSPDGSRLYFSSQRGKTGRHENGVTFEIMIPF
ncbi:alkaline phosphatase PhoX [Nitrosomonas sp. Nm33]|uniref:alkaline phosphatase PhoX n=1 Tax=Nitrosomonas sp. Nm33 TaxID=133724 RepID=UPI000897D830|nr:alkaline phosphatase PhoX [Nitrosomonas sp. Nm33]SDY34563.1 WD40-like Beta Propeller Repeat [Nitrosomonas sp. Nm33]